MVELSREREREMAELSRERERAKPERRLANISEKGYKIKNSHQRI